MQYVYILNGIPTGRLARLYTGASASADWPRSCGRFSEFSQHAKRATKRSSETKINRSPFTILRFLVSSPLLKTPRWLPLPPFKSHRLHLHLPKPLWTLCLSVSDSQLLLQLLLLSTKVSTTSTRLSLSMTRGGVPASVTRSASLRLADIRSRRKPIATSGYWLRHMVRVQAQDPCQSYDR